MNKLKGSLIAKSIAVILFCALCLGCAVSAAAAGMLYLRGRGRRYRGPRLSGGVGRGEQRFSCRQRQLSL